MIKLHDLCHRGHLGLQKTVLAEVWSVCDIYKKNAHLFFLPCWTYVQFPLSKCCSACASAAFPLAVVTSAARSLDVLLFHTPPFCRWLLQELVGTNYRGTRAIYCHLFFFFFVARKWKAISSLSLNLREAHYEHLARDCKNIWMLREKSKNEHGFSVARSYFQCVKYHKYFPFSYLLPLL